MTTFDPDSLEQDITVLQKIYFELGGVTALDCYVTRAGARARRRRGAGARLLDAAAVRLNEYAGRERGDRGRADQRGRDDDRK